MNIRCGMTRARILEHQRIEEIPVYFGTGVNPVNSPAQFFVAWGKNVLADGLIYTFNEETESEGYLWFVDEDEAEIKYHEMIRRLTGKKLMQACLDTYMN